MNKTYTEKEMSEVMKRISELEDKLKKSEYDISQLKSAYEYVLNESQHMIELLERDV